MDADFNNQATKKGHNMIAMTDAEPSRTITMAAIENRARLYAEARTALEAELNELAEELDAAKRKHLAALKRLAARVAEREAELHNAVEVSPELFQKPRTAIFHGVKVGFTTSPGKVEFDDSEQVLKLLRRVFGDEDAKPYIISKEEPSKAALKQLDVVTLAKVGCRIEGAGDVVVLKCVDGDIEKLVARLIDKMVDAMVDGRE
jgi:hypothetical protein